MFDTISGLPVHPLAVHAVVVLLPLMALVTVAVTARSRWRPALRWVVLADAGVLVAAFVAKESGERLQARLGGQIAQEHAEWGSRVPFAALGLLLAAAIAWYASTREGVVVPVSVGLVVVAAVAAVGLTVVTGDTGARAVWESVVSSTTAPSGEG